jgi:hypothetical protein
MNIGTNICNLEKIYSWSTDFLERETNSFWHSAKYFRELAMLCRCNEKECEIACMPMFNCNWKMCIYTVLLLLMNNIYFLIK